MTEAKSFHLISSISTCTLHNPPSIRLTSASPFISPLRLICFHLTPLFRTDQSIQSTALKTNTSGTDLIKIGFL